MSFARFVIGYVIFVIVWGAFVRATGSGAGCGSHWPLCNGEVLPTDPRWQTMVEFFHRLTSGLSLILVAALAWRTIRARPSALLRKAAIWSVVFILLEAAIGAGLVLLELVHLDRSMMRVISIALHLVNTSLLMAALAAVAHGDRLTRLLPAHLPTRRIVTAFSLTFLLLGATGAIAALGDTLFRHDTLVEGIAAEQSLGRHWLIPLRIYHPPIAVIWGGLLIAWAGQFRHHPLLGRPFWVIAGLIGTNFALGLLNIGFMAPVVLQLLHLLVANLLWVTWIYFALELARTDARPNSEM